MANETIKLSVDNAAHKGSLLIEKGGSTYALTETGALKKLAAEVGHHPEVIAPSEAKAILNAALKEIGNNGKALSNDVKAALPELVQNFPTSGEGAVFPALITRVQENVKIASAISADTPADGLKKLVAGKRADALHLLTDEQTAALKGAGHDMDAITKTVAAETAKAESLGKITSEFDGLAAIAKPTAEDITKMNQFVAKNGEHLGSLPISATTRANYPIFGIIEAKAAEATPLMKNLLVQQEIVANHPDAKAVEAATKEIGEITKKLEAVYDPKIGKAYESAIKSHIDVKLANDVHAINPKFGVAAEGAANAGKSGGFKFASLLMKNEAKLAETAAKKSVAVSELGFLSRVHGGKAAGLAVGAGAIAYIAGVGRNPNGKHTDQVAAQKLATADQSVGVA